MQDCYPDVVATVGLDVLIINLLNRWWYSGLPEKCKIHRNTNFIIELSELTVLIGEDVWTYLAGQGTNVDVVSIAPPKPGDGGPGILCHFILCFPRVLAVQADLLVIYTPSYFSQVFSSCEDKFTLGLMEHPALLETALPPLAKTRGVAIVISSYLSVECLPCFITTSPVFFKAFCSILGCFQRNSDWQ